MGRKHKSSIYNKNEKYIFASWSVVDDKKVEPLIKLLKKDSYRLAYSNVDRGITMNSFKKVSKAYVIMFFVSDESMQNVNYVQFMENTIQKKENAKVIIIMLEENVKLKGYIDFLTTAYQRLNYYNISHSEFIKKLSKQTYILECKSENDENDNSLIIRKPKDSVKKITIVVVLLLIIIACAILIYNNIESNENAKFNYNEKTVNLDVLQDENSVYSLSASRTLNNNSALWYLIRGNDKDEESIISASTPFITSEPDKTFLELKEYVMTDPMICDMLIRAVSDITIGESNYTYGKANTWIKEYLEKTASFDNGLLNYIQVDDGTYKLSDEYLTYASEECSFLEKFQVRIDRIQGTKWILLKNQDAKYYFTKRGDIVEEGALVFYTSDFNGITDVFGISLNDKQVIVPNILGKREE